MEKLTIMEEVIPSRPHPSPYPVGKFCRGEGVKQTDDISPSFWRGLGSDCV